MANDRSRLGTVVMDVILHFNLAAILDYVFIFPFLLTPAQLLSDGLLI
jgi:hypothetical protein